MVVPVAVAVAVARLMEKLQHSNHFCFGKIADTFEVMGLHHFPIDIENTIESCHSDIYRNGSCIFKCGDYTIVVCESKRTKYFASLVPLIINTILSKHHLVIDIVAFIKRVNSYIKIRY